MRRGLPRHPGLLNGGGLSLAESPELQPVGLVSSKRLLPGWTVIYGYDELCQQLAGLPGARVDDGHPERRRPDANIVMVPYDFRRSVAQAAKRLASEVHARLEGLTEPERAGRVIVVAHSMGGLVARYWLGPLGGWPVCRALITLGTPHRGAPKALDTLVDGARAAGVRLAEPTAVLEEWPSVAELLPRYPAVWDESTQRSLYPHELPGLTLGKRARDAFEIHKDIEQAWTDMGGAAPQVVPRLGWSHPTPNAAFWDGDRLRVTKDLPAWLGLHGWDADHGDGCRRSRPSR